MFARLGRRLLSAAAAIAIHSKPLSSLSPSSQQRLNSSNSSLELRESERLFESFSKQAPFFPHRGTSCVIDTPDEFFRELLRGIDRSEKRIILSSLYLGAGEQSRIIVSNEKPHQFSDDLKPAISIIVVVSFCAD
jgi:hypothetical protein